MKTGQMIRFVKNIQLAYRVFNRWTEQKANNELLGITIRNLGLANISSINSGINGNVGVDIGSTIKLMNYYNVKLHIGTSFGECRAILNKEDWQYPIDKDRRSSEFGSFFANQPHDKIDYIAGFGATVGEATCKCLINCKTAGVL